MVWYFNLIIYLVICFNVIGNLQPDFVVADYFDLMAESRHAWMTDPLLAGLGSAAHHLCWQWQGVLQQPCAAIVIYIHGLFEWRRKQGSDCCCPHQRHLPRYGMYGIVSYNTIPYHTRSRLVLSSRSLCQATKCTRQTARTPYKPYRLLMNWSMRTMRSSYSRTRERAAGCLRSLPPLKRRYACMYVHLLSPDTMI